MMGISDGWVLLAYSLSILVAIVCVVYGLLTWNRGDEPVKQEDVKWAKEEVDEVEKAV